MLSGLDARAAAIVMRTVRNTVNTGRTVVCTIHQPSIDIFEVRPHAAPLPACKLESEHKLMEEVFPVKGVLACVLRTWCSSRVFVLLLRLFNIVVCNIEKCMAFDITVC